MDENEESRLGRKHSKTVHHIFHYIHIYASTKHDLMYSHTCLIYFSYIRTHDQYVSINYVKKKHNQSWQTSSKLQHVRKKKIPPKVQQIESHGSAYGAEFWLVGLEQAIHLPVVRLCWGRILLSKC